MELFNLCYSDKNIPIPSCREYTKKLLENVESLIKRMRWKAFFYLNSDNGSDSDTSDNSSNSDETTQEYYGLKSKRTPPQIPEMASFEADMLDMVSNVKFRRVGDEFQQKLSSDVKSIDSTDKLLVHGDKTRNMYKMDKENYEKLLNENITQKYKLADENTCNDIDNEFSEIASKLGVSDRLDVTAKRPAFLTVKDHKDNFPNRVKCRLINPTKSEIGKVSKCILDKINSDIRSHVNVNQWRNTRAVLDWFNNLKEKSSLSFLVFDIVDFYPTITENLLTDALTWAKQFTQISDTDFETIMHARKTLLYDTSNQPWMKKDTESTFDVAMGAYDGAEVCELVGLFVLNLLKNKINAESIGLYRDDGLAVVRNKSGSQCDRMRKQLIRTFQAIGLKITVDVNLKQVN